MNSKLKKGLFFTLAAFLISSACFVSFAYGTRIQANYDFDVVSHMSVFDFSMYKFGNPTDVIKDPKSTLQCGKWIRDLNDGTEFNLTICEKLSKIEDNKDSN